MMTHLHANDGRFARIIEMGRNLTEVAVSQGLSPTKPVRVPVLGTNLPEGWYAQVTRTAIISYSQPTPSTHEVQLWVNPINKKIFKSLPNELQWKAVLTYPDLFSEMAATVPGVGYGTESVGQPVANLVELRALNTTTIPDKTMYYVESEHAIFALDTESVEPASENVIVPDVGPGRWYRITSNTAVLGNIDGGTF